MERNARARTPNELTPDSRLSKAPAKSRRAHLLAKLHRSPWSGPHAEHQVLLDLPVDDADCAAQLALERLEVGGFDHALVRHAEQVTLDPELVAPRLHARHQKSVSVLRSGSPDLDLLVCLSLQLLVVTATTSAPPTAR